MSYKVKIHDFVHQKIRQANLDRALSVELLTRLVSLGKDLSQLAGPTGLFANVFTYTVALPENQIAFQRYQFVFHVRRHDDQQLLEVVQLTYTPPESGFTN